MNEEEVKAKIVLPYLQRLGLQGADICLEGAFSLHIGTNRVFVDGRARKGKTVGGRFDFLIKRNGTNLFILELKESDHALTDDDRDQAVSYARLVHPIAPYTILTNGTKWLIFDSITKEPLKPEEVRIKDNYNLALPDADRNQALSFFLGYSVANLIRFCEAQVAEHLKPLIGSPRDLTKKYIPELTVQRAALVQKLSAFEASPASGFLVLAESGIGKTSALCEYAQQRLATGKPTLFFWGLTLDGGLLAAITSEFGWTFSEELTPVMLMRRLSELAKDAPVVIVVDAVNEWQYAHRAQSLVNLLRGCRDLRVKFVFSCSTSAWEGMSQPLGSDIGFASYLFQPADGDPGYADCQVGPLTDQEFYRAVEKYREVFNFEGAFEGRVLAEARLNPFMLRVLFSVAAECGQKHLTFSSREFFERYLGLLLQKCGRANLAKAKVQIVALARLMFDQNKDSVSDTDVRNALGLSPDETLLPALFERNILQQAEDQYSFYFQHLRSHLIAFKVCQWDKANPADLAKVARVGTQGEAFKFYLRQATPEQIRGVTEPLWTNALEYLELYKDLVARHFAQLDRELVRGEHSEVGFIGEYVVQRHMLGVYGFRRRAANEPPVVLVPVDEFFGKSNQLYLAGARGKLMHYGSSNGFVRMNTRKEVVEHEIIERVKCVIQERQLKLPGCEKIGVETLVSIIHRNRHEFEAFFDPYTRACKFPISIEAIRETIRRSKLRHHFEYQVIEQKRRKGLLNERWMNGGITYTPEYSKDERLSIEAAVDQAMSTGTLPELRGVPVNLFDLENEVIQAEGFGTRSAVAGLPWWTEYSLCEAIRNDYESGLQLVGEHIRRLYEAYFESYRIAVDSNFPTLKNAFALRAKIVSGQSKPARDGRMKTSHFESGIAHRAAKAAQVRDEPTQRESATNHCYFGLPWLVAASDRPPAGH